MRTLTKEQLARLQKEIEEAIKTGTSWGYDNPEDDEYEYIEPYCAMQNVISVLEENKLIKLPEK